jgi:hypothetical protein
MIWYYFNDAKDRSNHERSKMKVNERRFKMNAFETYSVKHGTGKSATTTLYNKVSEQPTHPLTQPLINIAALSERNQHLPHLEKVMSAFDLKFEHYPV